MDSARRKRSAAGYVVLLGLLTALGPLSIDLYLPAFPALQRDLVASDAMVQSTLAGMTIGLALGELFVGAWSDRVGRRTPLLLSTGLHVISTVGCALAPSVAALAAWRVAQGVGAAGSSVLVLAIARDIADGRRLITLLSRVTLVTTTAPLLAPVAGAALLPLVGWRGIFGVLAAVSAAVLVATLLLIPETVPRRAEPAPLRERLRAVWSDAAFLRATLVGAMTYAGVYAYVAASPLLLQRVYGLGAGAYAVVFLLNSLGLVIGVQLSAVYAKRVSAARVLGVCTTVTVMAAGGILPLQWAGFGLGGMTLCLWAFVTGCGGCFSAAAGAALAQQSEQSGTAASVYGFATFAAAGLASPLAGLVGIANATPVAVVLLVTSSTAMVGVALIVRAERSRADRAERIAVTS